MSFFFPHNVFERLIAVLLSISFLLLQTGCLAHSDIYQIPPPLSETARARLGTIGIVSADFVPEARFFAHSSGRVIGATQGMAFEPGTSFSAVPIPGRGPSGGSSMGGGGEAAAIFLGLAAAGLVIGGVYRLATWMPAEEVQKGEANLKNALLGLKMQESFKERFLKTARDQAAYKFVLIGEGGPKTADEILQYGSLNEKGVDTIIELTVLSIGFEGQGGKTRSFRSF